ncbi:SH3 domain-containing protein [Bacillus sp. 1P06AnD]|uniref:SH3 domain-containing protein n=1 Tax=Bacillus sp. 1P06AnD TaxID=3132208 RepID=UPI0039A292B6
MNIGNKLKGIIILALLFGMLSPFASPLKAQAASVQQGVVDITSGKLIVRSSPNAKASTIGSLSKSQKVAVLSQKNGWAQIQYGSKKGYVSLQYLRFYLSTSSSSVKKITDRVISIQRDTWDRTLSKQQIYSILAPAYTKAYIDGYFKVHMRTDGKRNGVQMYHINETDIFGYAISTFDWAKQYDPMPTHSYYKKNNSEYLIVSQYKNDEMDGNHTLTLSLIKEPKSSWKVYGINRVYDK